MLEKPVSIYILHKGLSWEEASLRYTGFMCIQKDYIKKALHAYTESEIRLFKDV